MKKYGKKILMIALAGMLTVGAPVAIPNTLTTANVSAATIKLSASKLNLKVGESKKLSLKGVKGKIAWSTSDKKIAAVSKDGKVTAKKAGKATITAKVNNKKYTCKVTIADKVKKLKLGKLTFNVPSDAYVMETQTATGNLIGVGVSEKDSNHAVILCDVDYASQNLTTEDWYDNLKKQYSEEVLLEAVKGAYKDGSIANYSYKEENDKYEKMVVVSYNILEEGKVKYKIAIKDILYNGHLYEIVIQDVEPESTVFNNIKSTILNSYKIAK